MSRGCYLLGAVCVGITIVGLIGLGLAIRTARREARRMASHSPLNQLAIRAYAVGESIRPEVLRALATIADKEPRLNLNEFACIAGGPAVKPSQ